LSSPSGQAPSANATCQSRRLRTPPTRQRTRLPSSSVEDVTERESRVKVGNNKRAIIK
jgi:hypothetical protein